MNKIQVMGHIGQDALVRVTPNGAKVLNFNVASKSKKKGEEKTSWYRVSAWGDRWDKLAPYLKKGSGVVVYGELSVSEWVNPNDPSDKRINLDITADALDFSPFGKPTEAGEAPRAPASMAPSARTTSPNMPFSTIAQGKAPVQKRSDPIEPEAFDPSEVPF
jgi:single-strand DNA-binding protein